MVVNVDDQLLLKIDQTGASNIGALDHEHGVVAGIHSRFNANVRRAVALQLTPEARRARSEQA
jgi:hypothetical protein